MKRIISIILALTLIATFSITAFADETETGSITINGISTDNTYEIYKLLDLESYDVAAGAYSYKANAAWATFFTTDEAKLYMATDKDGRDVFMADSSYVLQMAQNDYKHITFHFTSEF